MTHVALTRRKSNNDEHVRQGTSSCPMSPSPGGKVGSCLLHSLHLDSEPSARTLGSVNLTFPRSTEKGSSRHPQLLDQKIRKPALSKGFCILLPLPSQVSSLVKKANTSVLSYH